MTHNKFICDKAGCSVIECEFRHPRPCKYFKMYKRCKFTTYCKYSHEDFDSEKKNAKEKIETLENSVIILKSSLEKCLGKIEYLENEIEKRGNDMNEENRKIIDAQAESFSILETSVNKNVMEKMDEFERKFEKTSETLEFLKDTMEYCNEKFVEKFNLQLYPKLFCEKCKKKLRVAHIKSTHGKCPQNI